MKQIGTYAGIPVSLDWRDGQQVIVFTIPNGEIGKDAWYAIHGLANALGFTSVQSRAIDDEIRTEVIHTTEVDQRIMDLIDLLITARYEHPTIVQLSLQLDPSEVTELEDALS